MYLDIEDTKKELQPDLYTEIEIDADIIEIDAAKVIPWIDGAVGKSFTEEDLTGADSLIRLASCKYGAYSVMSSTLEGHNIEDVSLAIHRLGEAEKIIRMWCANNGIVPSFDIIPADGGVYQPVGVSYAYAVGSDSVVIG